MEYSISVILNMQIYIYKYEHDDHATEQEKKNKFNPLPTESLVWVPINIISKIGIMIML